MRCWEHAHEYTKRSLNKSVRRLLPNKGPLVKLSFLHKVCVCVFFPLSFYARVLCIDTSSCCMYTWSGPLSVSRKKKGHAVITTIIYVIYLEIRD